MKEVPLFSRSEGPDRPAVTRIGGGSLGGKAAGRIYGINRDQVGSLPEELQITYQSVRVHIRDGIAHTTVDQRFFNPTSTDLEGWYWFKVPEGASVTGFALETNGVLVEGEFIEKRRAAAEYERALRAAGEGGAPAFDWVMLGAGPDGHTASLFPGSELLSEGERLAAPAVSPDGEGRITLTLPVLNAARRVVFLAFGGAKREAAAAIRAGDGSLPAAMVRPERGPLLLYADAEALPE